jgi:Holliday junction resolvasome RuvABC endonuclease subunit
VPGNPLGLAAALGTPATGVPVYVLQVAADTTEGWNDAREVLETDQVYGIAPLTQDETQLVAFQSHVTTMSQPENKSERVLWQSHLFSSVVTRYMMDIADDSAVLKYPSTTQTLEVTHASGIVALGVIVGDVVTATYSGYFPSEGYITGTMTARISNVSETGNLTTLTLVADTTVPATLSTGVSLTALVITSREYTTAALKTAVVAYPSTVSNRRVRNVYPDGALITFDDTTNPDDPTVGVYGGGEVTDYAIGGWLMAAIAAAQRSGLTASTPLTNRSFSGIQRLVTPFKSISAIDAIIDGGNYVLQQPGGENGGVSTYRAITTDVTDLNYLEEAVTIQIDSFARKLRRQIKPLLGSTILDEAFFDMFSVQQQAVIYDTVEVQKELRSAKLLEVKESPTRADTFLASYQVSPYFSAANGDITIYI